MCVSRKNDRKGAGNMAHGPWAHGVSCLLIHIGLCVWAGNWQERGRTHGPWPMGCIHIGLCVEQANGRKGAHGPWGVAYWLPVLNVWPYHGWEWYQASGGRRCRYSFKAWHSQCRARWRGSRSFRKKARLKTAFLCSPFAQNCFQKDSRFLSQHNNF